MGKLGDLFGMLRDGWELMLSESLQQVKAGTLSQLAIGVVAHSRTAVALLQRGQTCYLPDQYEIPNDLLRVDESVEAGIIRVLGEQAGLQAKQFGGFLGTHDYKTATGQATRMFIFWVEVIKPKALKISPEFSHGVLVYFDEIQRYGIIDPFGSMLLRFWFGGTIEEDFLRALGDEAKKENFWRHKVRFAVRRDDGSLLILKRPRRARCWPMLYEFPGGDLDFGETLIEAGQRHLLRQSGLELEQVLEYLGHFDYTSQRDFDNVREFFFLVDVKAAASFAISEHAHGAYANMHQFRSVNATSSCALHVQGFYARFFGPTIEQPA